MRSRRRGRGMLVAALTEAVGSAWESVLGSWRLKTPNRLWPAAATTAGFGLAGAQPGPVMRIAPGRRWSDVRQRWGTIRGGGASAHGIQLLIHLGRFATASFQAPKCIAGAGGEIGEIAERPAEMTLAASAAAEPACQAGAASPPVIRVVSAVARAPVLAGRQITAGDFLAVKAPVGWVDKWTAIMQAADFPAVMDRACAAAVFSEAS